jgi:hypothetical protein
VIVGVGAASAGQNEILIAGVAGMVLIVPLERRPGQPDREPLVGVRDIVLDQG